MAASILQTCIYNPVPASVWSRVKGSVDGPNDETQEQKKGNILQHRANAMPMTSAQKYSRIATSRIRGGSSWAYQNTSTGATDPNPKRMQRIGSIKRLLPSMAPTNLELTCLQTYQKGDPIVIQDGGYLVCGTHEDLCNRQGLTTYMSADTVYVTPASASDVPYYSPPLTWSSKTQTWIPRRRAVAGTEANKFPTGYKGLVSAVTY